MPKHGMERQSKTNTFDFDLTLAVPDLGFTLMLKNHLLLKQDAKFIKQNKQNICEHVFGMMQLFKYH